MAITLAISGVPHPARAHNLFRPECTLPSTEGLDDSWAHLDVRINDGVAEISPDMLDGQRDTGPIIVDGYTRYRFPSQCFGTLARGGTFKFTFMVMRDQEVLVQDVLYVKVVM